MRRASERVDGAARVNAVSGKPYGDVSNDAGVENDEAARIHARSDYIYGVEWEPARSDERDGAVFTFASGEYSLGCDGICATRG